MSMSLEPRHPDPEPTAAPSAVRWSDDAQPAGRILVVMVASLVLAALVNADALVERAGHKALGPARDRSLLIWHPIQDLAHLTQLHRVRALGDLLTGNTGSSPTDLAGSVPADPRLLAVIRPELRAPSVDDPLRVYIGGDSVVRDVGESFLRLSADDRRLRTALHYEIATGLSRPDTYDWPATLKTDAAALKPELALLMFGGNDAQGIVGPDGTVYSTVDSPGWKVEYARRVAGVMDSMIAKDRLVLWITQPPMRDGGFDARIQIINSIVRKEAKKRPGVQLVESSAVLGDPKGRYTDRLPGIDGDLRQSDGIHLSRTGADMLARRLLQVIDDKIAEAADDVAASDQDERSRTASS